MWRRPSRLSGEIASGSKPPPLTRVARIGLETRLTPTLYHGSVVPRAIYFQKRDGPADEIAVTTNGRKC